MSDGTKETEVQEEEEIGLDPAPEEELSSEDAA